MRLHRLRVQNFAAIREAEVTFGPGLNVLYGPNDLGKSTLADAIRLVLLLPHTSTYFEPYVPWSGAYDPFVDLTFETEEQRFWRVRKQFGRSGSSLLQESKNGQDFDDVERSRGVDARLRKILGWGIPEPGGPGAGKGLPTSFLATALLSTQANVANVLQNSLHSDPTATGKEQIAAALQAAAQDPLFVALLRVAQSRRDEAYTDKGAKKTARGSVFKIAADRLKEAREEKDRLQKIVEESDGVERHLQELRERLERHEHNQLIAAEGLVAVEYLAQQAADCAAAAERVRVAHEAVLRIQKIDQDMAEAARKVEKLASVKDEAEKALKDAQAAEAAAGQSLKAAEEEARSASSDPGLADTVAHQALDLRKVAAEQAAQEALKSLEAVAAAQGLVDAALRATDELRKQEAEAARARATSAAAARTEQAANDELRRCDLLEHAWDAWAAENQVASARADVEREAALEEERARVSEERAAAAEHRAALFVPAPGTLVVMRKLATDLASARGALEVGLVVAVTPTGTVHLRVRTDGILADYGVVAQPLEIEASTEVEVDFADLATVLVRGGRREAQEKVRSLEDRWNREILPHLTAAGAPDLDVLDVKMSEARDLESRVKSLDGELESLGRQIATLGGASDALREASSRATASHLSLGDVSLGTLTADLEALGPDPRAALRTRRNQFSTAAETARLAAGEAATAQAVSEERARTLQVTLEATVAERDAALAEFGSDLATVAAAAQQSGRAALAEQESVEGELAALRSRIEERGWQLDDLIRGARDATEKAHDATEAAQTARAKGIADHSSEEGRLAEIRKLRAAEDLSAVECAWRGAADQHSSLPVPERPVTPDEVVAANEALKRAKRDLETVDREILTAQGALQQVGGEVSRDRLRDATEAFELAEHHDRETEADYEAWKLLLDQMREADAAQASNLGQALAPAIAGRFQALTHQHYQSVQLTANLGTEGVVVAGAIRSPDLLSIGTREQLSTLYRLCLGEYLQTTIVLDDQLVQSDDTRMGWFRALLAEKARAFQIVVFTCRPGDYLAPSAMVGEGEACFIDSDEGFVRAIELDRAVQRR